MYLSFSAIQVRIVLEGVDKFSNLTGSVYYPDGESAKDLSLELIEHVSHFIMLLWSQFCFSPLAPYYVIAYTVDKILLYELAIFSHICFIVIHC